MSNTLKALNSLAGQVPGLNKRALSQVEAARDISLQRQLGPQAAGAPQASAQQLATQRAMQGGQDILNQRKVAANSANQIRQAALQQKAQTSQVALQEKQLAQQAEQARQEQSQLQQLRSEELQSKKTILDNELEASTFLQDFGIEQDNKLQIATINQRNDLNRIGVDVKAKLVDARLQFAKDERGRKFTEFRQLADYTAANAKSANEFNLAMSKANNVQANKIAMMKQATAQLGAALERKFLNEQGDLDHEQQKQILHLKTQMQEQIRQEEAKARNNMAMAKAFGTVAGAGIGAVVGGPAGAAAGAQIGGSAATLAV